MNMAYFLLLPFLSDFFSASSPNPTSTGNEYNTCSGANFSHVPILRRPSPTVIRRKRICWGQVKTRKPHSELAYTFTIAPLGGIETLVRWKLADLGTGTRLELTHSGIPSQDEAAFDIVIALDKGWDTHFGKLRDAAAPAA